MPASVTGAITTIHNIDKEKRAVAALRASEERFRRFAENSGDVLWIYDAEKKAFDYISPAYGRIWGRPVEVRNSFLSRWLATVHPEDRELVTAALDRIASQGDTVSQSFRILRPDGAVRWIDATGFPIHDGENSVHSIGGIARDVTRHGDPAIYVIDADPRTCRARTILLKDLGHRVVSFNSESAFLNAAPALSPGCVIVRLDRPVRSGIRIRQADALSKHRTAGDLRDTGWAGLYRRGQGDEGGGRRCGRCAMQPRSAFRRRHLGLVVGVRRFLGG